MGLREIAKKRAPQQTDRNRRVRERITCSACQLIDINAGMIAIRCVHGVAMKQWLTGTTQ
jgi:hypothetical protein